MSQEWKEPTWQHPNDPDLDWDDSFDDEMLPLSDEEDEQGAIPNPSAFFEDASEEEATSQPFFSGFEGLRQLGQQISPILAPLLFAGLTFLFILPFARTNHFYLHAAQLWPVALVLIAFAVLQGMVLYYAGANNVFWSLGIVVGFLVFVLIGCFAVFGPLPTAIPLVLFVVVGFIAVRRYMHLVPEGFVEIVYSFSKYSRTLYPGLNFLLPWEWIDCSLNTHERQWTCPEQIVPISLDRDVHLKATISYQLVPEDAHLAITHVENWEESLHDLFVTLLQTASNGLTPDDFLPWSQRSPSNPRSRLVEPEVDESLRWERINHLLFQQMRDRVAQWGVIVNWVQIRDINLTPRTALASDSGSTASTRPPTPPPPPKPPDAVASTQPSQTQAASRRMGGGAGASSRLEPPPVQPAAPPVPPQGPMVVKASQGSAASPAKLPKEEVLIKAYEQIKSGKIRSPEIIRKIASGFMAIANDPEASKKANFDAARAAQALFERAQHYEELASVEDMYADDMPTQADWPYQQYRRSNEENIMGGG